MHRRIAVCGLLSLFLATVVSFWPLGKRIWVAHAQSGATYVVQSFASYQTHTLNHPTGLALSSNSGQYYGLIIADTHNNLIKLFSQNTNTLSTLAGNGTAGYVNGTLSQSEFHAPAGIGPVQSGSWLDINHQFRSYIGFNVNDSSNFVSRNVRYGYPPQQYTLINSVTTVAGSGSQGYVDGSASTAQFSAVTGHNATSPTGPTYYILDTPNHAVRTLANSQVATFAGNGTPGYINGFRTSARFNYPTTVTWDSAGSMYVSDSGNHAIRKIDTSGNVTTFAGSGSPGFVNAQGASAKFYNPVSIVFNSADNYFYVTDTGNNSIRRIDQSGNVTTYAGATQGGLVNGSLSQARFQAPTGLAIGSGFIYVADSMNNAIRRIDMSQGTVSTYIN